MKKAVLLITFNRFETTKKVFERIRKAQPPRLYLASNGARPDVENEGAVVSEIRSWLLNNIDWECEVHTLFREKNLEVTESVPGAMDWFFQNEPDGIMLEDDCLPSDSFFDYCEQALDKYKDNKDVWHISGANSMDITLKDNDYSAYFSKCITFWGWACWADRWKYYTPDSRNFDVSDIAKTFKSIAAQIYWLRIYYRCQNNISDSCDYRWMFDIMGNSAGKGICIAPAKNLIKNIGYYGTNYKRKKKSKMLLHQQNYELENINLPDTVVYDDEYDRQLFIKFYRIRSFMFKFILKLLAEFFTFNYNGESMTIIKQVIKINKHKRV